MKLPKKYVTVLTATLKPKYLRWFGKWWSCFFFFNKHSKDIKKSFHLAPKKKLLNELLSTLSKFRWNLFNTVFTWHPFWTKELLVAVKAICGALQCNDVKVFRLILAFFETEQLGEHSFQLTHIRLWSSNGQARKCFY